jgi:23S rRNA (cytosine1962-C5)-methyltransferase
MPDVTIARRGAERHRAGHPWIYRSDVASANAAPGDVVLVRSERGRPLGWALWSESSAIAIRMITADVGAEAMFDEDAWLRGRFVEAAAYRDTLRIDADACRLVHGEADRLPALIVDRYGDYLVVQALCQGMDRRMPEIVRHLVELFQPRGILARNDPKVRRLEGLDLSVDVVHGEVPEQIDVRIGAVRYTVDLRRGQKTGLFLDQRENHQLAATYARGRALDAFTYNGGFALHLAGACEHVTAIDSSAAAVAVTRDNAARNGLAQVEAREANVFDALRAYEADGRLFETIVLDPPAFAKNKASVSAALGGYKEINLRAMKLLAPGGHLFTCSCSYNVDEALFEDVVRHAAIDARASMALVEKRQQARDHPVLVGVPETHYLKALVLRKLT